MTALFYLYIFIIGLCVGSFLNVVLFRLDRKKGILTGRSQCQNCLHKLNWYDLIPIFSYLYLKGNCRYCKSEISIIYPLVEFTAGICILAYFLLHSSVSGISIIYYLAILILFLLLIFFDALYLILPDKITFSVIGVSLIFDLIFRNSYFLNFILSGFLFSLAFAIIYLMSHGQWMGLGDVKLVFGIGLVLGYSLGLVAIISAIWVAALWGIFLIILKKANLKTALPFGSFLSASTVIFIIFQNVITEKINFYFYFF